MYIDGTRSPVYNNYSVNALYIGEVSTAFRQPSMYIIANANNVNVDLKIRFLP